MPTFGEIAVCRVFLRRLLRTSGWKLRPANQGNASMHRLNDDLAQIVLVNQNWNLAYLADGARKVHHSAVVGIVPRSRRRAQPC